MPTSKTDETKTVKVELDTEIRINGVLYAEGSNDVPAEVAEDLVRINKDHNKYQAGLNKNSAVNGSLGSRSAA